MLEDRLRSFRLSASASTLRDPILGAAVRAGRERRVWRWTWAAAGIIAAVAVPLNLWVDAAVGPAPSVPRSAEVAWPAEIRTQLPPRPPLARIPRPRPLIPEEVIR